MKLVSFLRALCCCGDTGASSEISSSFISEWERRSANESNYHASDNYFDPREHHLTPYGSDESAHIPIFFQAKLSPAPNQLNPKALRKAASVPVLPSSMG